MKLKHYTKQATNTVQQQRNNTTKQKINKINAVSNITVQRHSHTDEMVY